MARAQALFDQQLRANGPSLLGGLAETLNPAHAEIFAQYPCRYYWSVADSEWASDVLFSSRAALEHEISSNVKERLEGVRIKHWLNGNSLKMYDKGSVLRAECMIRYLEALSAVQATTPLRQLVEPLCRPALDPARRRGSPLPALPQPNPTPCATLPQTEAAALAEPNAVPTATPPERAAAAQQVKDRARRPRRVRALNPLAAGDAALLEAVSRHEFLINGRRNRDLRRLLYGAKTATTQQQRRQSAAVTRQLRLLRAHGLIHKVPNTQRYMVSQSGRQTMTALLAARNASTEELIRCAG